MPARLWCAIKWHLCDEDFQLPYLDTVLGALDYMTLPEAMAGAF